MSLSAHSALPTLMEYWLQTVLCLVVLSEQLLHLGVSVTVGVSVETGSFVADGFSVTTGSSVAARFCCRYNCCGRAVPLP